MNNKMMKLSSNIIKITTPKMTSSSITLNGVTFTSSGVGSSQDAFNIDKTIMNESRNLRPYTLNFSRKILVQSYCFGGADTNGFYNASGYMQMYNNGVLVYSTNSINNPNSCVSITPVFVDSIVMCATNSSWYANEGGYGQIRGMNLTGLIV